MANRHDLSPPQLSCGFSTCPIRAWFGEQLGSGPLGSHPTPSPLATKNKEYGIVSRRRSRGPICCSSVWSKRQLCFHGFQLRGNRPWAPWGGPIRIQSRARWLYTDAIPSWRSHVVSPDPNCRGYTTEVCWGMSSPGLPLAQLKPSRPSIWLSRPSRGFPVQESFIEPQVV